MVANTNEVVNLDPVVVETNKEVDEAIQEVRKEKKASPAKKEKVAKVKKPSTSKKKLDRYGFGEGTMASKIALALPTDPRRQLTTNELAEKSGCEARRVYEHMRFMLGRGLAVKGDKGYTGKPPVKEKKAPSAPKNSSKKKGKDAPVKEAAPQEAQVA
jgi:hypothetical protein